MHYDFRLELDGVLKSWAVPKGPRLDPAIKSLAVQVEDHPLQYATFEGVIPQGEYGGGTVMVWDHGTWEPKGDPGKQLRAGKLTFQLNGKKLKGRWTLVQMHGDAGDGGKNWLLIKRNDKAAKVHADIVRRQPRSVISGRAMAEIAEDADRTWKHDRAQKTPPESKSRKGAKKTQRGQRTRQTPMQGQRNGASRISRLPGARRAKAPTTFKPQLATLADHIPSGDNWLHELKFDGYRCLAFIDEAGARLVTRNGNDWSQRFPTIIEGVERLTIANGVLDGEIVSLDDDGRSDFQLLQNQMNRDHDQSLVYYVFDVPFFSGYDLTATPLIDRKELLARIIPADWTGAVRYSDHIQGQGPNVFSHACRQALEGVVSKLGDSSYVQGRSRSWLKVKCLMRQEFVIGGYTKPSGSRIGFGALLLGYQDRDKLRYAGRVGTGFRRNTLRQLSRLLKRCQTTSPPFAPRRAGDWHRA